MNDIVKKKFEPIIEIDKFAGDEIEKAQAVAAEIELNDSQAIVHYGVPAQKKISDFADTILGEIRSKDSDYIGEILSNLVVKVKDVGVEKLSTKESALKKVPIIGNLVDSFKHFVTKYDKLNIQIEKIVEKLEGAKMELLKSITLLDSLYEKNLQYLKDLDIYIAAGQIKLQHIYEKELPEMQEKAEKSKDLMVTQNLQDYRQFAERFEKKLHDLKLSRMIAIQTGPQVRMVQGGNQTLYERIQSSILNTIPLWKNQVIIAISLFKQKKALELQKDVADTTNELLQKNAEMLKAGTLDIAKEAERGIVDIESLKKVNNELVAAIEETLKIQQEGRTKRREAEAELLTIESDLKEKLIALKPGESDLKPVE